ncbi:GtrA family protein [Candidatus Pacearchaeota archaeon]|nr:GtrA family protein [Candidatus Pacearchaeota archaeon]
MKRNFFSSLVNFLDSVTSLGGAAPAVLTRFIRYLVASSSTLLLDLFLLGFLTEFFGVYYLVSVGFSYTVSTTINYFINWKWGFKETKRHVAVGYVLFLAFGIIGFFFTISLMWIFVDIAGLHYSLSRIIVAIIEGAILFVLNSTFTFRIPLMEMAPYSRLKTK